MAIIFFSESHLVVALCPYNRFWEGDAMLSYSAADFRIIFFNGFCVHCLVFLVGANGAMS